MQDRRFNGLYTGHYLDRVAFPLGGIGAGMVCLEGTGALSHVSLRHRPEVFHEPLMFSALSVKGASTARILEGRVPKWKVFGPGGTGNGGHGRSYGLPRFTHAEFLARFPFASVNLHADDIPLSVELTGWSPFVPGDADRSSLPMAALEYRFTNATDAPVEAVYSFHAANFLAEKEGGGARVEAVADGFLLGQKGTETEPWRQAAFVVSAPGAQPSVDLAWFRGGWFDPLTMLWQAVTDAQTVARDPHADGNPGNGASLYVPLTLAPGESRTIQLLLSWYVPFSNLCLGGDSCACQGESKGQYQPWYAGQYGSATDVAAAWREQYADLREASAQFRDCFHDTTLPDEVVEAVAANLTILKSPTCLRQKDGRFWGWEGCCDGSGCCHGSCTHVWNYAQAIPHLFPELEQSLRETEFLVCQDERGHQTFRTPLPIRAPDHGFHAAADGQLGGIMKVFREWRISGDTGWLQRLWPRITQSLDYCIKTWDPRGRGVLEEPHHNTYDIEFWGPDGMCSSFYLGALKAAIKMGRALEEDVDRYESLYRSGREFLEGELFDGEYFIQQIQWQGLDAPDPTDTRVGINMNYSPEARALLEQEGPKYQYGTGCLSDGVLGAWLADVCGVGQVLDEGKVTSHLLAIHRHNLREDLTDHANPQRPTYAVAGEGGLLLCSWPKGGELSLPFVYSNEVWTGIEYQVASHLMLMGHVKEGLDIVRLCRQRYDGRVRNPFNEYECGHWYARAMSSYAMLASLSGARYDALTRTMYLQPRMAGDFRAFISTAGGYGTVGMRGGEPFLDVVSGEIPVESWVCSD
jgi:uncharacterized protein (DUF608 family)